MLPIGPLMIEHRLIERMLAVITSMKREIKERSRIDPGLVDATVDFIRTYADRTHHGKEEDILFQKLAQKDLSADDGRVMQELIEDHKSSRKITGALSAANQSYRQGDDGALAVMLEKLDALMQLYPQHIAKEDKVFFPAAMRYLDQKEKDAMLAEMGEFDKKMIHEKYTHVVDDLTRSFGESR
jgi:hemerythrin-like domain-containing protein